MVKVTLIQMSGFKALLLTSCNLGQVIEPCCASSLFICKMELKPELGCSGAWACLHRHAAVHLAHRYIQWALLHISRQWTLPHMPSNCFELLTFHRAHIFSFLSIGISWFTQSTLYFLFSSESDIFENWMMSMAYKLTFFPKSIGSKRGMNFNEDK